MATLGVTMAFLSSMIRELQIVGGTNRQIVASMSAVGVLIGGLLTVLSRDVRRSLLRNGKAGLYLLPVVVTIILAEFNSKRLDPSLEGSGFKAAGYAVLLPVCYILLANAVHV